MNATSGAAPGPYDVQVISAGVSGNGFQQQTGGRDTSKSNSKRIVVNSNAPAVTITSRPITVTPSSTPGQYVANLTSYANPPGGSYTWSTDNPNMVGFSPNTPSSGASADHVTLVIISTNDRATITLQYVAPSGVRVSDTFTFALSNDTTVVAWIDPIPIQPDPNFSHTDYVYNVLTDYRSCAAALYVWGANGKAGQGRVDNGFTDAQVSFANHYLNAGSGNNPPPSDPNATSYIQSQDYRMYNRLQAYYEVSSGRIIPSNVGYLHGGQSALPGTSLGVTPEPCTGFQFLRLPVEPNAVSGEFGVTADFSLVYQITETRLGPDGQAVNQYLNGVHGGDFRQVTPWIYSVIQFDADGKRRGWAQDVNVQIFPSYQPYDNGFKVAPVPEGDLSTFIGRNAASQYTGPRK